MSFRHMPSFFFFFNDTATTEIYTLSLHDALPICLFDNGSVFGVRGRRSATPLFCAPPRDRKSTRLNSSHVAISYAVFCLKKKKKNKHLPMHPRRTARLSNRRTRAATGPAPTDDTR